MHAQTIEMKQIKKVFTLHLGFSQEMETTGHCWLIRLIFEGSSG